MAALSIAGATLIWLFAPLVIRWRVESLLRESGAPAATVESVRLDPWGTTIAGLVTGQGLTIERIAVVWTWTGLWHGQVQTITVSGVDAAWPEGQPLVEGLRQRFAVEAAPGSTFGSVAPVPLDLLRLERVRLAVALPLAHGAESVSDSTLLQANATIAAITVGFPQVANQGPSADVRITDLAWAVPAHAMTARIDGTFDWALTKPVVPPAATSLTLAATWNGHVLDPLVMDLHGVGTRVALTAKGRTPMGLPLELAATADLAAPAGSLTVAVAMSELAETAAWGWLVPQVRGWQVSGQVGFHGSAGWTPGSLTVAGEAVLAEVSAELSSGTRIEGVSGSLLLSSITPPVIGLGPGFAARRCKAGPFIGEDLHLAGTLTGSVLAIDHLDLRWCDGVVALARGTIDLAGQADIEAQVTDLDLTQVLAVLAPGRLTGQGRLSGSIPLKIAWPAMAVTIGAGRLAADPPLGWWRFEREEDVAWIWQGIPTVGGVNHQLQETVRDFAFDHLAFDAKPQADGLSVITLDASGRGRGEVRSLPIGGLVVNIRGVEAGISHWLRFGSLPEPAPADGGTGDPAIDDLFK